MDREKRIYRTTVAGSVINTFLTGFKFAAGFIGGSGAMIADAVHSLTDFLTDIVVLVFVKMSSKPQDDDHDYGHGKYETLATVVIGLALFAAGVMIIVNSVKGIVAFLNGSVIEKPGMIAFIAAVVSIILKEWAYRFTVKVGSEENAPAVVANAWHHRSDALSSIGTAVGIGGAALLGGKWAVLDPVAALVVGALIIKTAVDVVKDAAGDLLERSLPSDVEDEIRKIAGDEPGVSEVHNLRTRRIGNHYAMEMHVRMPGNTSLYEAHLHASSIESRVRERFGARTHVGVHVEPLKEDGRYVPPVDN